MMSFNTDFRDRQAQCSWAFKLRPETYPFRNTAGGLIFFGLWRKRSGRR